MPFAESEREGEGVPFAESEREETGDSGVSVAGFGEAAGEPKML